MRRTTVPNKERERFVAKVKVLLLQLAAQQNGDEFILETRAGRLTLYPTGHLGEGLGTVFARFEDPEAARQLVDCNPFSGKWNFHYFNGGSVETAVGNLMARLQEVLA